MWQVKSGTKAKNHVRRPSVQATRGVPELSICISLVSHAFAKTSRNNSIHSILNVHPLPFFLTLL